MFLIVGLGNPGEEYSQTRHNVGFQCVKYLADRHGLRFDDKRSRARLATGTIAGQRAVLAKPFTFMNASGEAVAPLVHWYKLDPSTELLVVYDELDLPLGTLRLRGSGSSGGHNGMNSIIRQLGTDRFPRLRVGISRPPGGWQVINYVLGRWRHEEIQQLDQVYSQAADAIEVFIREGLTAAMNRFNSTKPPRQQESGAG